MSAPASLVYTPHPLRPLHLLYTHVLCLYYAVKSRLPKRSLLMSGSRDRTWCGGGQNLIVYFDIYDVVSPPRNCRFPSRVVERGLGLIWEVALHSEPIILYIMFFIWSIGYRIEHVRYVLFLCQSLLVPHSTTHIHLVLSILCREKTFAIRVYSNVIIPLRSMIRAAISDGQRVRGILRTTEAQTLPLGSHISELLVECGRVDKVVLQRWYQSHLSSGY